MCLAVVKQVCVLSHNVKPGYILLRDDCKCEKKQLFKCDWIKNVNTLRPFIAAAMCCFCVGRAYIDECFLLLNWRQSIIRGHVNYFY